MKNKNLPPRLIREAEGVDEIAANLPASSDEELGLALEWLEARKLKRTAAFKRVLEEAMSRPESRDDILADFQIRAMQDAQSWHNITALYRLAHYGPDVVKALESILEFGPAGLPKALDANGRAALAALRGRPR